MHLLFLKMLMDLGIKKIAYFLGIDNFKERLEKLLRFSG